MKRKEKSWRGKEKKWMETGRRVERRKEKKRKKEVV